MYGGSFVANMSSHTLRDQRIKETIAVYTRYNGDRRLYAIHKRIQEAEKRQRQTRIPASEVNYQFGLHKLKYPRWFDVQDGTDKYCVERLMSLNGFLLNFEKTVEIPVNVSSPRDMYNILQNLIEQCSFVESIAVACTYNDTTVDVPQKLVLMKHEDGDHVFQEYLKHQERPQGPFVINDIVGGKFDDPEKAVLVTNEFISHTRYLYKDWSRFQFHPSIPKHDKQMKLCFGVVPETISVINIRCENIKITLYPALNVDDWKIDSKSVMTSIETVLFFNKKDIDM